MSAQTSGNLTGKLAVVTGASRGLGRAVALSLSAAGAGIALVARDLEKLNSVKAEIEAAGGTAWVYPADVVSETGVLAVQAKITAEVGHPQILVNNAGMNIRKNLTEFTLDEWNQVLDTNLTSVFLMCRAFVPGMKGTGYGRIVNTASIMGHVSLPGRTAYSSSKAALLGLTKALALELAGEGITVNAISPGPFATEMMETIIQNPELSAQFLAGVPLQRWGKVEEMGALVRYLCSEEAGFITGTDILIDGGWTAR